MTDELLPWPTLREFLDAGGDLFSILPFDQLIDDIYGADHCLPFAKRLEFASETQQRAIDWMTDSDPDEINLADKSVDERFRHCRALSWGAELTVDEALAERVRALLTPEQRAEGEKDRDLWLRPHPLEVRTPQEFGDVWTCCGCGAEHPMDVDGFCAGYREGHSSEVDDPWIQYCRRCIEFALFCYDQPKVGSVD